MPMNFDRRQWLVWGSGAVTPCMHANEPGFPSRPIELVTPSPAGINADNIARISAKRLSEQFEGNPDDVRKRLDRDTKKWSRVLADIGKLA